MTAITNYTKNTLSISQKASISHVKTVDVLSYILSYLEGRELARSSLVCRQWKKLIEQPELWQALLCNCFNFSGPLDHHLLKPAFRHNFLFHLINTMQSHRQAYTQSGDWRISGGTTIMPNGTGLTEFIIENTKRDIAYQFLTEGEALTELKIESDHVFAKCSKGIYFTNFKKPSHTFRAVRSYFEIPGQKWLAVRNGFILLTHNSQTESICELIPWRVQYPIHFVIVAKPNFFSTVDCLELDNGWLYAIKITGSKYLAWNLKNGYRQTENDAVSFKNIPFNHNGKSDFFFFNQGTDYYNLLFQILSGGDVIIRDIRLNNQIVKAFAKCQTQDGTFNTTLFESLLNLCLIHEKMINKPSDRCISKK